MDIMDIISTNMGNIIVGGLLAFLVYRIIKSMKKNPCGCSTCPSAGSCQFKNKQDKSC